MGESRPPVDWTARLVDERMNEADLNPRGVSGFLAESRKKKKYKVNRAMEPMVKRGVLGGR